MLSDVAHDGVAHAFKTAFDENYATYSPGIVLETHNLKLMHDDGICFGDSCTVPDNQTMNRIWGQKVEFQNVVVGLGSGMPTFATMLMPTMQKLYRAKRSYLAKKSSC